MAFFSYRGTDHSGKTVEGRMEAQDAGAVATRLQELGFFPLGIIPAVETEEAGGGGGRLRRFIRGKGQDRIHFTRQLAVLLGAGLPLDRSLAISAELVDDESFRGVIARVRRNVVEGGSLGEALARHPRYFSDLFVSMVKAGEVSGSLDRILTRLADFLEEWQRFRDIIITALLYPLFLMFFAASAVVAILLFVVPRFAVVFADMGRDLPAPTRVLIGTSAVFRNYWWVFAAALALLVAAGTVFLRSRRGRFWWDRTVLTLPLIGELVRKVQVSRFARVLGTLVKGGVPILKALEIVIATLTNTVFSRSVARVQTGLKEGQGVAEPLRRSGVFPPLFIHMVTVGEETGKLEEMLLSIASTYDEEVERGSKRLLSLFEPVIILAMGVVVGTIVLSILWAIFSVNQMVF
jgi:general secretion pathway protein F